MKKCKCIFFLVLLIVIVVFYSQIVSHPEYNDLRVMGILGFIQLLFSIWSWKYLGKELINPYLFFLVALYTFSFGQSLLYVFNIVSERRDLIGFQGITFKEIFDSQVLTLVMLSCFHIGAILSVSRLEESTYSSLSIDYTKRIRRVGWVLFIVSIIPYFSRIIQDMIFSMMYGYGALYERVEEVGISQIDKYIGDYFVPSLICLFVGYRLNPKMRYFIFGLCLFNIVAILLTGGRTYAVILFALLILLYHYGVKRISLKGGIVLVVFSVLFLTLLTAISHSRSESKRSVKVYFQKDSGIENGVTETIAEMGSSMFCLIKTKEIVPSREDYRYGRSYFYSFMSLIPNLGFWDMHPARLEANLGNWLTNKLGLSYGTGYSMCAEAYINFGIGGSVAMLILGFLLGKIFKTDSRLFKENPALLIFSLILFWFCLKMTRNSFIGFVRAFFYYALPIYYVITRGIFKRVGKFSDPH